MAKESCKSQRKKRERLVAKYLAKRAALKAAGDWKVWINSKEFFACKTA